MGGKHKNKGRVLDASGETWASQRRRGQAKLDEVDRAALEAFTRGLYANRAQTKEEPKRGDGSWSTGLRSRPVREGDPPPGPPTFQSKTSLGAR